VRERQFAQNGSGQKAPQGREAPLGFGIALRERVPQNPPVGSAARVLRRADPNHKPFAQAEGPSTRDDYPGRRSTTRTWNASKAGIRPMFAPPSRRVLRDAYSTTFRGDRHSDRD
jgi:hypothetical protein